MKRVVVSLALVALTFAVFAQVRHHELLNYDDRIYVTDNPNLRDGLTVESIVRAFREPYETNWIPLTWLSLHVDYALWELEPAGYLLTNVALHALSAVLLFLALLRMTGALPASAFVAAVFAVHPLHVESVAWASERKDTLSGVFFMLALLAYAAYAERPRFARYLAVFIAFGLGLLAKATAVTLPFALLLLDYWPLRRLTTPDGGAWPDRVRLARAALEKLPLLALAGVVSAVTFYVQSETGAMNHGDDLPLSVRIPNAAISYGAYLRDSVWPSGLAVFYPHPGSDVSYASALAAATALAALSLILVRLAPRQPWLLVGWLWFLGTLIPMIGIVQVGMQARADRYMYVPLIGLAIALAFAVRGWAGTSQSRQRVAAALGIAAVLALATLAWRQVGFWRDTETLHRHSVAVTEDNFLSHNGYATMLARRGLYERAEEHYREAMRIKPRWPAPHFGLGDLYAAQGDYAKAVLSFERGLRLAPRDIRGHLGLAQALAASGSTSEALGRARYVAKNARGEQRAEAYVLLGGLLAGKGTPEAALAQYDRALEIDPNKASIHKNRAFVLLRFGRPAEAEAAMRTALELGVDDVESHTALGDAVGAQGRGLEATGHYRDALARDPRAAHAANNLAWLLATSPDPALRDPEEAIAIAEPFAAGDDVGPALLDTLSVAYAAAGRPVEAETALRQALALAEARGEDELASDLRARLDEPAPAETP